MLRVRGVRCGLIARHLGVSVIMVRRRLRRFRDRVGATTRIQAVVTAARRGWL